jgi:hypothetical protein
MTLLDGPIFYIGLHHPNDAAQFPQACLSINVLRRRKKQIACEAVLVDSGAFTELATYGRYRHEPSEYAEELRRLMRADVVNIEAAVSQDFMCEPFMLAKTGLTVADHQRLTIERYDALVAESLPFPIMPVLQGYRPEEYAAHIQAYGDRLKPGMWVGVGSVCKRNGNPEAVLAVLWAIHVVRPDLRLHGFGVKQTSLEHHGIRSLLYSADSMAWSFAARKAGRDQNSVEEAKSFAARINAIAGRALDWWQPPLLLEAA